ncbi:MAG: hypothetical protein C5B50_14870 [Verrucomicrobia bacterium]|nr:MAG: hypothetical protein C5B50_14870 [Verrucomicrobiota bacterium]
MPAQNRKWLVALLLFTGMFINALDRASLSTAAPIIMRDLKLDPALMGLALSAFFWTYLPMNIPAGILADKFGAKVTLAWAGALWAICSAATGMANRFAHVLASRLGVGIGESATFPVNARIIRSRFAENERGTAMSFCTSGLRLGFAVTPLVMAWLISRWNWRTAFYVTGLGSLLWVGVWSVSHLGASARPVGDDVRSPLQEGRGSGVEGDGPAHRAAGGQSSPSTLDPRPSPHGLLTSSPTSAKAMLALLKNRTVLGLVLCKFFQDYLFYLFVTWLPGYLILERRFDLLKTGWCVALPWFAGFLLQPLAGWISDSMIRRGYSVTVARKAPIITLQLLAGSVVLVGFANSAAVAVGLLTFSVAAESGSTAILWTACADVAPPGATASLAGIMNSAGALAGIAAPALTGLLVKATGSFQNALVLGGCTIILAGLAIGFVAGKLEMLGVPKTSEIRNPKSEIRS